MDFIPIFHFVTAIMMFGFLMYVYNPIIQYLAEIFPSTGGPYFEGMMFMWGALLFINLIGSGIRLVMLMQKKR